MPIGRTMPRRGVRPSPVGAIRRAAGAVATLVPLGSTWGAVGDGLTYQGTAPGINSTLDQLQRLMGLRIQPVPEAVMAVGGSTIKTDRPASTQYATVFPYLIDALAAQVPDIFMFLQMGRNDLVLSTDPGSNPGDGTTTSQVLQDWYDALNRSYTAWLAYAGSDQTKRFVISFSPSASNSIANESTYRVPVWNAQFAKASALKASDSRVLIADMRDMTDATLWSSDGTQRIHYDERGAYHVAEIIYNVLSPEVVSATDDAIIDMIEAGTYKYQTGTQRDTNTALTGTGGTITGPGVTGTIATGKVITNTTGATGITVSQVVTTGGRTKTVIDLSAATATSAAGRIYVADTANLSLTGVTPGQDIRTYGVMRASNFRNMGADVGNYGTWGSTSNGGNSSANETHPLSSAIFIRPRVAFTTGTAFTPALKRGFGISFISGQTLSGNGTIEIERPGAYLFSNRTAAAPKYIGDTVNSQGTKFFNAFYQMQPRGTVSAASGGTVRVEPGRWNLGGLTENDFAARRIYKGGTATPGSGTLLATISGATWTFAIGAGATTQGDLIYVEVDCNNGVGPTVTARGSTTITVGA